MSRSRGVSIDELGADVRKDVERRIRTHHNGVALGDNSPLRNGDSRQPRRARSRDLEHPEQVALFAWVDALAPQYPQLGLLYAIPNYSGNVSKAVRARLKREGKRRGMLDICLPVRTPRFGALYIEMKSEEGRASDEQLKWIRRLREAGNRVEVANSATVAKLVLCDYLGLPIALAASHPASPPPATSAETHV